MNPLIKKGDNVKVVGISCHLLAENFGGDFEDIEEINGQQVYLGCVGKVHETYLSGHTSHRGYVVYFVNGDTILVLEKDLVVTDEEVTTDFTKVNSAPELHKPFTNDEKELLDKVIVALSHAPSKFADAAAIVETAVDIVVERTRVYNKVHLRN